MKVWNRTDSDDGISSAMVGPATLPELARALDPSATYVLLSHFTPIQGPWRDALIPLAPEQAMNPTPATVRRVTVDVLLDTAAFTQLAHDLAGFGIDAMQFRQKPRSDVYYDDPRPRVRAARYRAAGLTIRIDLPHARETAMISATDPQQLDAALHRLRPRQN